MCQVAAPDGVVGVYSNCGPPLDLGRLADEPRLTPGVRAVAAGARRRATRDGDRLVDTAHLLHSLLESDPAARDACDAGTGRMARVLGYLVQRSIGYGLRWSGTVEESGALPVLVPPRAAVPRPRTPDGGVRDRGASGTGSPDGGVRDRGASGTGSSDSGYWMAGSSDSGQRGAGSPDAGQWGEGPPGSRQRAAGSSGSGQRGAGTSGSGYWTAGSPESRQRGAGTSDARSSQAGWSPAAAAAMRRAVALARRRGRAQADGVDLLDALAADPTCRAREVLRAAGLDVSRHRGDGPVAS
jgi:hypothetical protein